MTRLAILTGGGDAPGLNAVIRAAVKTAINDYNAEILGIKNGFDGFLDEGGIFPLNRDSVRGILPRGGTILGAANRGNPFARKVIIDGEEKVIDYSEQVVEKIRSLNLDALIVVGGDGTLGIARDLHEFNVPVIGVPKTIDNDIGGTDFTFGFDTAVTIATDALDRLHSTAESHSRVMILEVMGRDTGWIAIHAGMASGADVIIIPEFSMHIEEVVAVINRRHKNLDKTYSIVVIAEGITPENLLGDEAKTSYPDQEKSVFDAFGHKQYGGISHLLAKEIEARTGIDARAIVLGYLQRGGTPTPRDRFLATMFGVEAYRNAKSGNFGTMMALNGTNIVPVKLSKAVNELKRVPAELYERCKHFFG